MYNTNFKRICAGCALAMALTLVAAPVSAFAAPEGETPANKEVNAVTPGDANPEPTKKLTGINPTAKDDTSTEAEYEGYVDTDIDVWGYTNNATIYSVDVEWGAMTFEYEASSWDPVEHKSKAGRGWLVYDNANDEVLGGDGDEAKTFQDAINRVKITNHSNADVYAKLTYTGVAEYSEGGTFTNSATADTENVKATWDETNNYFTLKTATTNAAGDAIDDLTTTAGEPSVGNVYFRPNNKGSESTFNKWTKIGKITVAITTEDPTSTPVVP